MWVQQEQKYFRKSTRTKNLDTALSVGKEFYLDVHFKLRHNEPIFSKNFKKVVEEFLEEKKKFFLVNKRSERLKVVQIHTNYLLNFVGEKTNLLEVQNGKWNDYYSYRQSIHPKVVNGTLLNEKGTIGSLL